jgi:hypothetical protein
MENLLQRLEQLYESRKKLEEKLLLKLRYNNLKYASINDTLENLNELRIRIEEVEAHITLDEVHKLKTKLNIFDNKINF